jgi:AraC family transcriptional regulator, transcriptional activator of the genes for pyochelin and ferripyochelin receptors
MTLGAGAHMEAIDVSPEMLTLVGVGELGEHRWPLGAVAFEVTFDGAGSKIIFHFKPSTTLRPAHEPRLLLIVTREACERVLGQVLDLADRSIRYLPAELSAIAVALRDCAMPAAASTPYRLAKSIELLCEILNAHRTGQLAKVSAPSTITLRDIERIIAARKIVDECWHEKLTLCQIAQRCGLNRSKLARGFRQMYCCSVNEALLERRLAEARRQLISTDLPVGMIGYRSGYNNNASFSRAFCRRFGVPPSNFRSSLAAA